MSSDQEEKKGVVEVQLVSFLLGAEEYAIDILNVQEIIRMTDITKVPRSQNFIEGIINLRGVVIPVIDLRTRFGMKRVDTTGNTRVIVVRMSDLVIGFIVDQVQEVLRLSIESVDTTPDIVRHTVKGDFIKGVGKHADRLLILLDIGKILEQDEKNKTNDDAPGTTAA